MPGQVFIVLKVFLDGSGKSDDPESRFLTLAGCSAEDAVWAGLEEGWAEEIHMSRLMSSGMPESEVLERVERALLSVRRAVAQGMKTLLYSVNLKDYRRWKYILKLPQPERLCAEWCVYQAIKSYSDSQISLAQPVDVFFDQNEPFLRHICMDNQSKKLKRRYPLLGLVRAPVPVDSSSVPPVQVADMFSWSRNRLIAGSHDEFRRKVANLVLKTAVVRSVTVNNRQFLHSLGLATGQQFDPFSVLI